MRDELPLHESKSNTQTVDKIKTTLIQKAKAKQQYVKLLAREKKKQEAEERPEHLGPAPVPAETYEPEAAAAEMHPDRLTRNENLDRQADAPEKPERKERTRPPRRSNPGYAAEQQKAEQKRLEQEAREKEILAKEKAKRIAIQERNRKKKLMTAKSVDGRKQLGKQSSVLLSKIQQQMST